MDFKSLYLQKLVVAPQIKEDVMYNLQNVEGVQYIGLNLYENFPTHQIIGFDEPRNKIKILIYHNSDIKSDEVLDKVLKLNNYYTADHFELHQYTVYDGNKGYITLRE